MPTSSASNVTAMSRNGRIHRAPLAFAGLITLVVAAGGGAGVFLAAEDQKQSISRDEEVSGVLAANDGPAENFLIVGSDSRANSDQEAVDFGVIGDAEEVSGSRSDSIMILRRDPDGGAALLSIPRDLWVPIAGLERSGKINWAFNGGASRLAQTVTQALGIPVHHYIEIDFDGFSRLVDSFGGVPVCIDAPAQDSGSGLAIPGGCQTLAGPQALAFVRSRQYEAWDQAAGDWVADNKNDLGRIERQQFFVRAAAGAVLDSLSSNPFLLGNLLDAAAGLVTFDTELDLVEAGESLRAAFQDGLETFRLPVVQAFHGDQDALDLDDGAEPILDYFRGIGPRPAGSATTESADNTAATATDDG